MADINEKIAQFIITNSTLFHSKTNHPESKLYFLADTEEIYRGDVPFSTSVIFYSGNFPESPAERKLYINQDTFTGYVWSNDTWNTVIEQFSVISEINAKSKLSDIPNVEAIKKFIRTAISDMSYKSSDHSLNYILGDIPKKVVIDEIITGGNYDKVTNILTFKNAKDEDAFTIKFPKDNFPVDGYYDELLKCIILRMRSDVAEEPYELKIPVGDLLSIKCSKVKGNLFKSYDDGYGVVVDLSGKIDKVPEGLDGRILTAKEDGNANAINKFVGGSHFSLTELPDGRKQADPNTLATEAGVMHLIGDINDNIKALQDIKIVQVVDKDNPSESEYPSEAAVATMYQEIDQILSNIQNDISKLDSEVKSNSQGSEDIKTENNNINQKLDSIETFVNGDVKNAVDKVPAIEESITNITQEIDNLESVVQNVSINFTQINDRFNAINSSFAQLASDCENINDTLTTEFNTLKTSFESLSSVQTNIENTFNNQIKEIQAELDNVIKESANHIKETEFKYYT